MVKLTVVGSLNYDLVSYTERVPQSGETFQADSFETHTGGKGLNQTISIAKLLPEIDEENKVRIIGKVGDDGFGEELTGILEKYGVDVSNVEKLKGERSGVATILVEKATGENRILIVAGANGKTNYTSSELEELFPESEEREIVVFQNEIPGTKDVIHWLNKNRYSNTEIVYNPSPYHSYSASIISQVDILVVNETESLQVAKDILKDEEYNSFLELIDEDFVGGYSKLATSLKSLINTKKSNTVVITLGSKGSLFTSPKSDESIFVAARKVDNVVDTTGAGDTFLGGLLTQVSIGKPIQEAVEFASFASSLAVQKAGASESIPQYSKVIELKPNV